MQSQTFKAVAAAAERFSQRPSNLLGITDAAAALDVDLAAWAVLAERDRQAMEQQNSGGILPPDIEGGTQIYVDGKPRGTYRGPQFDAQGKLVEMW